MSAHTPGPWDLEEIPYETNDPAGGWYLHFDPTGETSADALYMSKAHVSAANARLIAAAPDLFYALQNIEANLTGRDNFAERVADSLRRARAAIAKAEGDR